MTTRGALIEERKRRQWTQQEVADRLGTTQNTVSRWELGMTTPGPYFQVRLCELFDKTWQELSVPSGSGEAQALSVPQQVQDPPHPSEMAHPVIWHVPFRRNPCFTGREAVLQRLHEEWQKHEASSTPLVQVICGLGGMGKTQVALEYAYRHQTDYQAVLWVRAGRGTIASADFALLARHLGLDVQEEPDQQGMRAEVKRWLASQSDWLLILDSAADQALLDEILPTEGAGHLLLTTQNRVTGTLTGSTIELGQMEPDEGALFLLRRSKCLAPDGSWQDAPAGLREAVRVVSEQLGGLPLALDQAGAYIEETGCSLDNYAHSFQEHRIYLLARRGTADRLHPDPVSATLSQAIAEAGQITPVATRILRLCAFVHAEAIPEEFVAEGIGFCEPGGPDVLAGALAFDTAMHALRSVSLIARAAETKTLRLHRLVQEVVRDGMDEQEEMQWVARAVLALDRLFPTVDEASAWPRGCRFLPHVQACAPFIARTGLACAEAVRLLYRTGRALHASGQGAQAEPLLQQARAIRDQSLDPLCTEELSCMERSDCPLYTLRGKCPTRDAGMRAGTDDLGCPRHLPAGETDGMLPPESDVLAPFLREWCVLHPQASCSSQGLWEAYLAWAHTRSEPFPLSRRDFARRLQANGVVPARTNARRIWRGIALLKSSAEVTQGDAR